jgi:hypothetical protein
MGASRAWEGRELAGEDDEGAEQGEEGLYPKSRSNLSRPCTRDLIQRSGCFCSFPREYPDRRCSSHGHAQGGPTQSRRQIYISGPRLLALPSLSLGFWDFSLRRRRTRIRQAAELAGSDGRDFLRAAHRRRAQGPRGAPRRQDLHLRVSTQLPKSLQ